jgi:hypothetical protein
MKTLLGCRVDSAGQGLKRSDATSRKLALDRGVDFLL